MKLFPLVFAGALALAGCGGGTSSAGPQKPDVPVVTQLPPKAQFHLFLLAGQSNMAGRGKVEATDQRTHPRVLSLNEDGNWVLAIDPIHFDKRAAGVGPGRNFALALVQADPNITIGLIPAAVGGSSISAWQPNVRDEATKTRPYDDALSRSRRALEVGTLKGILWHQGESDTSPAASAAYEGNLKALIARFRTDLAAPNAPFLIGQLGRFAGVGWSPGKIAVDAAHQKVASEVANSAFVSSQGLTSTDGVHFDAPSAREMGRRYATEFLKLR